MKGYTFPSPWESSHILILNWCQWEGTDNKLVWPSKLERRDGARWVQKLIYYCLSSPLTKFIKKNEEWIISTSPEWGTLKCIIALMLVKIHSHPTYILWLYKYWQGHATKQSKQRRKTNSGSNKKIMGILLVGLSKSQYLKPSSHFQHRIACSNGVIQDLEAKKLMLGSYPIDQLFKVYMALPPEKIHIWFSNFLFGKYSHSSTKTFTFHNT